MRQFRVRLGRKASSHLAILGLVLLICVVALGKMVGFIHSLNESMSKTPKNYTWDNKTSINLVVKSKDISLLNYDPQSKKIVILKIPSSTYFDLPHNLGSWSVASIYSLGQEENPPAGPTLLKDSLTKLLGLPIDDFVIIESDQSLDKIIASWHSNPLKIIGFVKDIKSDLTPLEAFSLFKDLSDVRTDKISYLDIEQSDITESKLLPDSSRVLGVNSINLDLFIRDKMPDQTIINEGLFVAIFNGTSHPGLAQEASRLITNLGANVIFTSNTDSNFAKSAVLSDEPSLTLERLSEIFAPHCLKQKCQSDDEKISFSRAKINIIIGEDFYQNRQ